MAMMASHYTTATMLLRVLILNVFMGHRHLITAFLENCSLQYCSPGDINLGGIFSFYTNPISPCMEHGGHLFPRGVFQAESLRFAVDMINNSTEILPNVTLGYHIVDDGWSEHVALEHTLNFLMERVCTDCSNTTSFSSVDDVVGIIGLSRSTSTVPSARLAQLYEMPLISYHASSEELADKSKFSYFLRTVPPDGLQVGAIVDLLETYQWNYIGLVHSIDSYGIHGARQLQLQIEARGICVAFVASVSDSATEKELGEVVTTFEEFPMAKTVVMFASARVANTVLEQIKKANMTREITWIGSDDWGYDLLNKGFAEITRGAIFTRFFSITIPTYEDYVKELKYNDPSLSPWIRAYWDIQAAARDCSDIHSCDWIVYDDFSAVYNTLSVIDAVYVYAHGLHTLLSENCGNDIECQLDYAQRIRGKDLFRHLKNVDFKSVGGRFRFDEDTNPPVKYNLRNWQLLDGLHQFIDVGLWQTTQYGDANLTLNKREIKFGNQNKTPASTCWPECSPGEIIVPLTKKCCFGCTHCQDNNYIVISDTECDECPIGMWPNGNYSVCEPIVPTAISWVHPIALVIMIMACIGLILVAGIIAAMILHSEHRIIKASGRELSAINFVGICMCFLTAFVLLIPPTGPTCIVVDAVISLSFTLTYASTLLKVNRIFRIFRSAQKGVQRPSWIGPKDQLVISAIVIFVQVIILLSCAVIAPTKRVLLVPNRSERYSEYYCHFDYGFLAACAYNAILILLCCYYAFMTRRVPDNYNESKFIGISVYSNVVVCLAVIPVYSVAKSALYKVSIVCLALIVNAYLHILCVYVPKIYAVMCLSKETSIQNQSLSTQNTKLDSSSRDTIKSDTTKSMSESVGTPGHKTSTNDVELSIKT